MAYQRVHISSSWQPPSRAKSAQPAPRPVAGPGQQDLQRLASAAGSESEVMDDGSTQRSEKAAQSGHRFADILVRTTDQQTSAQAQPANAPGENRTGMPLPLKAGLEQLSGLDLSAVRVHYNSDKPAQLNALAYTKGHEIEVGPGQERHLPHEAWHVVQQAQGRVKPTMQMKDGVPVNDDTGLEREADAMGTKAADVGRHPVLPQLREGRAYTLQRRRHGNAGRAMQGVPQAKSAQPGGSTFAAQAKSAEPSPDNGTPRATFGHSFAQVPVYSPAEHGSAQGMEEQRGQASRSTVTDRRLQADGQVDRLGGEMLSVARQDQSLATRPIRENRTGKVSVLNAEVIQRSPTPRGIKGRTHLVIIEGGSIYEGTEGPEITDANSLVVEPDDRILSRRGPNQEVYGLADRFGDRIYSWVQVVSINGTRLQSNKYYVREDALDTPLSNIGEIEGGPRRERLPEQHSFQPSKRAISLSFTLDEVKKKFDEVKDEHQEHAKKTGKKVKVPRTKEAEIREALDELVADERIERVETSGTATKTLAYRCLTKFDDAFIGLQELTLQELYKAEEVTLGTPLVVALAVGKCISPLVPISSRIAAKVPKTYRDLRFQIVRDRLAATLKAPEEQELDSLLDARLYEVPSSNKPEKFIYSDWFQDIGALMEMLATRRELPVAAITKLLKYALMRNQLQAPLGYEDMRKTGRQTSPLVSSDYARGMDTKLWLVATQVQKMELLKLLNARYKNNQKAAGEILKSIKAYTVVATPGPFVYGNSEPQIIRKIDDLDDNWTPSHSSIFFQELRLQIMKTDKKDLQAKMGARGLRSSLGQSAQVIANAMAKLIKEGKPQEALKLLEGEFSFGTQPVTSPLSTIDYNTLPRLVVPYGSPTNSDPLLASTADQLERLREAYELGRAIVSDNGELPFLMRSNFAVFEKLLGSRPIREFFGVLTPAQVTATVTDALTDIAELMKSYRILKKPEQIAARKFLLERYYEKMQVLHEAVRFQLSWMLRDPAILHEGIRHMLPEGSIPPASTFAASYGLAMIDQVGRALGPQTKVGVLKSSYYETPGLFEGHQIIDTVENKSLLDRDLIVLEPHPNNAEEREVKAHDPVKLLQFLSTKLHPRTVLMDITLNHMGEKEIAAVLDAAAPMIKSGDLNLVLMQSGTKFLQHGMDIVSLGIAAVFNDKEHWVTFNAEMSGKENGQSIPEDDALYLGQLLTTSKNELRAYLDQIRSNTSEFRKLLLQELAGNNPALQVTVSNDDTTVYVAIAPTPACVTSIFSKYAADNEKKPSGEFAMKWVYKKILEHTRTLSLVTRPSFGFNLSNLGECITTIRITPGIEEQEFFEEYAKRIGEVDVYLQGIMDSQSVYSK